MARLTTLTQRHTSSSVVGVILSNVIERESIVSGQDFLNSPNAEGAKESLTLGAIPQEVTSDNNRIVERRRDWRTLSVLEVCLENKGVAEYIRQLEDCRREPNHIWGEWEVVATNADNNDQGLIRSCSNCKAVQHITRSELPKHG